MGKMEKFGVKYTSICYEKWGTHALFCSRHSHNFSKDETTLYIARATIKMPFKVRFLMSDAIKIKLNTVVFYYYLWFDFYCIRR